MYCPTPTPRRVRLLSLDLCVRTGIIAFDREMYNVNPKTANGQARLVVTRSRGTQGPVTVGYATNDGTAVADQVSCACVKAQRVHVTAYFNNAPRGAQKSARM